MIAFLKTSPFYLIEAGDCYIQGDPLSYTGTLARTVDGADCLPWTHPLVTIVIRLVPNPLFPESDTADAFNYCRDPTGLGKPWCYTMVAMNVELCDLPMCPPKGICNRQQAKPV